MSCGLNKYANAHSFAYLALKSQNTQELFRSVDPLFCVKRERQLVSFTSSTQPTEVCQKQSECVLI